MLRDDLEGWDGGAVGGSGGREGWEGGGICIHRADSICCTAETAITL